MAGAPGRRSPGSIPKLSWPIQEAEVYAVNRFLKRLAEVGYGHPAPHATTHMVAADSESGDSIASGQMPSTITLGSDGDIGDATLGYATADHDHPNDFGGLGDLEDVETIEINGATLFGIFDPQATRLLSLILLELREWAKERAA